MLLRRALKFASLSVSAAVGAAHAKVIDSPALHRFEDVGAVNGIENGVLSAAVRAMGARRKLTAGTHPAIMISMTGDHPNPVYPNEEPFDVVPTRAPTGILIGDLVTPPPSKNNGVDTPTPDVNIPMPIPSSFGKSGKADHVSPPSIGKAGKASYVGMFGKSGKSSNSLLDPKYPSFGKAGKASYGIFLFGKAYRYGAEEAAEMDADSYDPESEGDPSDGLWGGSYASAHEDDLNEDQSQNDPSVPNKLNEYPGYGKSGKSSYGSVGCYDSAEYVSYGKSGKSSYSSVFGKASKSSENVDKPCGCAEGASYGKAGKSSYGLIFGGKSYKFSEAAYDPCEYSNMNGKSGKGSRLSGNGKSGKGVKLFPSPVNGNDPVPQDLSPKTSFAWEKIYGPKSSSKGSSK